MARWTGTWLQGPDVSLGQVREPSTWPGSKLGLPREGTGAVATFGARALAFLVDIIASSFAAGLVIAFVSSPTPNQRQGAGLAVLALEQAVLVALTGQTLGMRVLGLRVVGLRGTDGRPTALAATARSVLLALSFGLAGFFTRDGRGLHDLVSGTAVVRT